MAPDPLKTIAAIVLIPVAIACAALFAASFSPSHAETSDGDIPEVEFFEMRRVPIPGSVEYVSYSWVDDRMYFVGLAKENGVGRIWIGFQCK